jgi:hypothetical protein
MFVCNTAPIFAGFDPITAINQFCVEIHNEAIAWRNIACDLNLPRVIIVAAAFLIRALRAISYLLPLQPTSIAQRPFIWRCQSSTCPIQRSAYVCTLLNYGAVIRSWAAILMSSHSV